MFPWGKRVMRYIFCTTISLFLYLALTAGSGTIFYLWSPDELVVGFFISLFVGFMSSKIIPRSVVREIANPIKWIFASIYMIGPFFLSLLIANREGLYRIITGRIKPAIVKVETGLKSETGIYFLSNSITLSPGTLTMAVDEDTHALYIHCLNWEKEEGEIATPNDVSTFSYFWMKNIFG